MNSNNIQLNEELLIRYITGKTTPEETARIECEAAENGDFMQQIRTYIFIRDNFNFLWDNMSADVIRKLCTRISKQDNGNKEQKVSRVAESGRPPLRFEDFKKSNENFANISIKLTSDDRGMLTYMGPRECFFDPESVSRKDLGLAAFKPTSGEQRLDTAGKEELKGQSVFLRFPLESEMGQIVMKVAPQGHDNWVISVDSTYCYNKDYLRKLKISISKESGEIIAQGRLANISVIPITVGKWSIKIESGYILYVLEINLCQSA